MLKLCLREIRVQHAIYVERFIIKKRKKVFCYGLENFVMVLGFFLFLGILR